MVGWLLCLNRIQNGRYLYTYTLDCYTMVMKTHYYGDRSNLFRQHLILVTKMPIEMNLYDNNYKIVKK